MCFLFFLFSTWNLQKYRKKTFGIISVGRWPKGQYLTLYESLNISSVSLLINYTQAGCTLCDIQLSLVRDDCSERVMSVLSRCFDQRWPKMIKFRRMLLIDCCTLTLTQLRCRLWFSFRFHRPVCTNQTSSMYLGFMLYSLTCRCQIKRLWKCRP